MPVEIHRSFTPEDIQDFQSLKGKGGHFARGLFIAEGPKVVEAVLASRFEVVTAFMTEEYFTRYSSELEASAYLTRVILAPKEEMERIVGYSLHQGLMLAVRVPRERSIAEAARSWKQPFVVVALDSIADAENMGAIIRNCAAFGVDAIVMDDQSCNPYLRRSVRVSMGTIVAIEILRAPSLPEALKEIRAVTGARVIGAALTEASRSLYDIETEQHEESVVLVFGSEGWGLRPAVMEACDTLVQVPMADTIDSLNVAIANGIFLYAFSHDRRQRSV